MNKAIVDACEFIGTRTRDKTYVGFIVPIDIVKREIPGVAAACDELEKQGISPDECFIDIALGKNAPTGVITLRGDGDARFASARADIPDDTIIAMLIKALSEKQ